tara:strand:+ start:5916 stop:6935 length:1020 start_codon:yes stop_codon:yes gene_type:complete
MSFPVVNSDGVPDWSNHTNGASDLLEFLWDRTNRQGRAGTLRTLSFPREFINVTNSNNEVNTFMELQWRSVFGGSLQGTANTPMDLRDTNSINYAADTWRMESFMNIGEPTNAVGFGKVVTHGGFRPLDVVIQEDSLVELDSDQNHAFADVKLIKAGSFVLDDLPEQIRAALHQMRSTNLPTVFTWSSRGGVAFPDWKTPGSVRGMAVNSEVDSGWVNLLDHAVQSRNSTTPGVTGYAHHSGLGLNVEVPVTCYVLGQRNSSAGSCQVRFESSWSNAIADLTYNGTGSLGWVGVTGLTLNSASRDDDPLNGNKIDIYGLATAGTALTIFGLVGIIQYPT